MRYILIIWFIILTLLMISLLTGKIPFLIPIILWLIPVLARANEKIGNYFDAEKTSIRNEGSQLKKKAEEMAGRGVAYSGFRAQEENRIKDDFESRRREAKRKFWVDLVNVLFLK